MKLALFALAFGCAFAVIPTCVWGQESTNDDPVFQRIWEEGVDRSELYSLGQTLLDSIGPRLTGSPEQKRANEWAISVYQRWGIPARADQYGTWLGWSRGIAHIDLITPRARSLEGMLSTWSPGTNGTITGPIILFPRIQGASDFEGVLPQLRGKFVLISLSWPSCRPDGDWKEFATPDSMLRMQKERSDAFEAWYPGRIRKAGVRGRDLARRLADAGVLGIVSLLVPPPGPQGWGVSKISTTIAEGIPEIGLSCEDYGLVFRLAENNQSPLLSVTAPAQFLGEVPVWNVVAELQGKEKPDEFVLLSAHFDSWDAASGATDNGATTIAMMEAMRILKTAYPNPKRTIIAAHWSGEEQGFNGSRAFAVDHPGIVNGLQAVFDHDNGTGRVVEISMDGFVGSGLFLRRWLSKMPREITGNIRLSDPGSQSSGIDAASFTCSGVPAFSLSSVKWDYETYTWHTNLDTFDKLVFDDLKKNAVLFAMLAYAASEDDQRLPWQSPNTPPNAKTQLNSKCPSPARSWAERRP